MSAARSDFDCFQMTGQKNLLDLFPSDGSCKEQLCQKPSRVCWEGLSLCTVDGKSRSWSLGYREELGSPATLPGFCRWNLQCCIAELTAPWLLSFPVIFPGKWCTCHGLRRKCLLPYPSTVQKKKVILALKYCTPLQNCTLFMLS